MAYTFPEITFRRPADEAVPVAASFDIGTALRALPVLDRTVGEPRATSVTVEQYDRMLIAEGFKREPDDCDAMRWADDGGRC